MNGAQGFSEAPIAGIRMHDGMLHFVERVPAGLPAGAMVFCKWRGQELRGTITIPSSLVAWCDPEVERAEFVSAVHSPDEQPVASQPDHPPAGLNFGGGIPEAGQARRMLDLAQRDLQKLDR